MKTVPDHGECAESIVTGYSVETVNTNVDTGIDGRAFVLALATFAIGADAFIIAGILPEIAGDLAISIGSAGSVVSVFSLSYAIGSPVISALTANSRRSVVLIGGLGVFTLANLLSAASPNLAVLLATRIFAALSAGCVAPACYALASTLGTRRNRGKILAVIAAGFTGAIVLGVPIGLVVGYFGGWRGSLLFVAALGATAASCLFAVGIAEPACTTRVTISDQLHVMGRATTSIALAPFLVWSMANFGLYTFIAAILRQSLSPAAIPGLLFLFGLGAVAGNFMGGVLSDRFGTRRPTQICLLALIVSLALVDVTRTTLTGAGLNVIGWGVLNAALFTVQQQRAIAVDPARRNLLLALNNSALYLGASLGAAICGVVISTTALDYTAPAAATLAAGSLVMLLVLPAVDEGDSDHAGRSDKHADMTTPAKGSAKENQQWSR
jgi:DHA1 family inner membrane transport protein